MKTETVAVIPARGGSKRIPRKNVRLFRGKPLIGWPILAALESECFDRVIVSTDDPEIGEIAEKHGAEVPFLRPSNLADDFVGTRAVIVHAIEALGGIGKLDVVASIYPTAALVQPADICNAMESLGPETDMVVSVAAYQSPIQRALILDEQDLLSRLHPEYSNTRTQDLPHCYYDAGQFYIGRSARWCDTTLSTVSGSRPYILPVTRAVDIDDDEDWKLAEACFDLYSPK